MAQTLTLILYRGQGTGHVTGLRLLPRMGAFSPSGSSGTIPGPNYYPWPQGPEPLHSSLGAKRRGKLAKALHEATEREEPEPKKKRKKAVKKKEAPIVGVVTEVDAVNKTITVTATRRPLEEPPIDREPEPAPALEETYVPRITRSISGIGTCRGRRRRAIFGQLGASGGGEGKAPRLRRRPRTGRLQPEGIQNPSIVTLLTAA